MTSSGTNDHLGQVIPSTHDWAYLLQALASNFIRESSFEPQVHIWGYLALYHVTCLADIRIWNK